MEYLHYIPVLLGILIIVLGIINLNKRSSISKWPRVSGTIKGSWVKEDHETRNGTFYLLYSADIGYSFKYKERDYFSSSICYMEFSSSLWFLAERKVEKYKKGKEVEVYVSPQKPEESYLELPPYSGIIFYWIAGVLLASIPFFIK